jgi:hypothetical protein
VQPVVEKLFQALQTSSQVRRPFSRLRLVSNLSGKLPEAARALAIQQLQTLSGVAKGLTRTTDVTGFENSPVTEEVERMQRVRDDIRMVRLREDMLHAIEGTVELWSTDAGISEVCAYFHEFRLSLW